MAESAGTEMALAPGERFGRALRALTAVSQAEALRDEMKTLEQPAWRKLYIRKGDVVRAHGFINCVAGKNV